MEIFEQWESNIRGYCRVYPTVFKTAQNATQVDEQGRSYIDFFAGAGVLNFGHNNPKLKRAIIDYLEADGVTHTLDMYSTAKREFIAAFADTVLAPRGWDYKMQFVGPTGTNAVEAALKLARRVTGRHEVVAFGNGFHGMTLGSLACTANSYFRNAAGVPLDHVHRLPFEGSSAGCSQCLGAYRAALADGSSGVEKPAAFLVEVVQAEGGVNVATAQWLQQLQTLAREVGALLIVDDIQVGCGRTGSYFSFDNMEIEPDIITLAKGIGGYGTPLAMNLIKPEHDKHWSPGEHTGTFRGQNLSFVAGREALRYFEDESFLKTVRDRGGRMAQCVEGLVEQHAGQGLSARGRGMIHGLDVGDGERAKAIVAGCFEQGLLVSACGSGGRVIKLIPPLTIEDDTLDQGLATLERVVGEVLAA